MQTLKKITLGLGLIGVVAPQAIAFNLNLQSFGQSIIDNAYQNPVCATMAAATICAAAGVSLRALYNTYQQHRMQKNDQTLKDEISVLLMDWVNNDKKNNFHALKNRVSSFNLLKDKQTDVHALYEINAALKRYNDNLHAESYNELHEKIIIFCDLLGLDKLQVHVKDRHTQPVLADVHATLARQGNETVPTQEDSRTGGLSNLLATAKMILMLETAVC